MCVFSCFKQIHSTANPLIFRKFARNIFLKGVGIEKYAYICIVNQLSPFDGLWGGYHSTTAFRQSQVG